MKKIIIIISIALCTWSCQQQNLEKRFDVENELNYCVSQVTKTLNAVPDDNASIPRNILNGEQNWNFVKYRDWTSGFWPGILWYIHEYTGKKQWQVESDRFTQYLMPLTNEPALDHDLGFQLFCSAGNGYRLTSDSLYKQMVLKGADTLATLFNPLVGTIHSWPSKPQYPHNTIVDNMINLEMLFWAAKNGGNKELYNIALSHAETTMKNHFREDYSSYHLIAYDTITGAKIKGVAHQGYANESMWARGQAWGIYGYTMVYRETHDAKFLNFAHQIAKIYLERLPQDLIPYWDFDAPNIPNEPKDASAAAVVASALLELSQYTQDKELSEKYMSKAKGMLVELSGNYKSDNQNSSFLLHSTGHHPKGTEIDASIIYADYYYLEALLRLRELELGNGLHSSKMVTSTK